LIASITLSFSSFERVLNVVVISFQFSSFVILFTVFVQSVKSVTLLIVDIYLSSLNFFAFCSANSLALDGFISHSIASVLSLLYSFIKLLLILDMIPPLPSLPNTESFHNHLVPCLLGTGIIGIDHNVVFAKSSNDLTTFDSFHIAEVFTAAHTRNRVIAIHKTDIIILQIFTHIQAKFNSTNHPNIGVFSISPNSGKLLINLTNTVDILIAKHIIAGEKIIPIKFCTCKYLKNFTHNASCIDFSKSNALSRIIIGDNVIANHSTQILIINTTAITINGIQIAIICPSDTIIFKNDTYTLFESDTETLKSLPAFNNDQYNAVNTHTYHQLNTSFILGEFRCLPIFSLLSSNQKLAHSFPLYTQTCNILPALI
jgi:hypothetical protein